MEDDDTSAPPNRTDDAKSPSPPSPEPELREDQIQNAVSFLSHPKVRGSPKASKISFLEQKGLTQAEIDEAFKRVPDTPVPSLPPLPAQQQQPQPSMTTLATTSNHLLAGTTPVPHYSPLPPPPPPPHHHHHMHPHHHEEQPIRWSQVALGAGFAAASVYAVKSLVWPFVADKYSSWRGSSSSATTTTTTDAIDAIDAPQLPQLPSLEVAAVADAIRAQTAELTTSIQTLKQLVSGLDLKQRPDSPEVDRVTAAELRDELRGIAASLTEIAGPQHSSLSMETELTDIKKLLAEYLKTPRSGGQTPGDVSASLTPGSYRSASERPSHSGAPSPAQLLKTTTTTTTPTPTTTTNHTRVTTTVVEEDGDDDGDALSPPRRHPASYLEVLEMLERGETPPGIRDDINDVPPNPQQPPPASRMKPPRKPWEQQQPTTATTSNSNGDAIDLSPVLPAEHDVDVDGGGGGGTTSLTTNSGAIYGTSPREGLLMGNATGNATGAAALSIYEAATTSKGSPGVIAGRLSPSDGGGGGDDLRNERRGVTPTMLFPEPQTTTTTATSAHQRMSVEVPDEVTVNSQGSGLGRPSSRGWRPPPIPIPTLGSMRGEDGGSSTTTTAKNGGSQASLGADFASA